MGHFSVETCAPPGSTLSANQQLEFEKGKGAIVLKGMEELVELLPKLIDAAEAGEFDNHIVAAGKPKTGVVVRRPS